MLYGLLVSSVPMFTPSRWHVTPAIPFMSLAVAVSDTVPPLTVAQFVGDVSDTVGGVVLRMSELFTNIDIFGVVNVLPYESMMLADKVWLPSGVLSESHAMLYVLLVSKEPSAPPS